MNGYLSIRFNIIIINAAKIISTLDNYTLLKIKKYYFYKTEENCKITKL